MPLVPGLTRAAAHGQTSKIDPRITDFKQLNSEQVRKWQTITTGLHHTCGIRYLHASEMTCSDTGQGAVRPGRCASLAQPCLAETGAAGGTPPLVPSPSHCTRASTPTRWKRSASSSSTNRFVADGCTASLRADVLGWIPLLRNHNQGLRKEQQVSLPSVTPCVSHAPGSYAGA